MSSKIVGNKRPVESILVASGNQSVLAPGVDLLDAATEVVNLADGQLGIIDASGRGNNTLAQGLNPGDTVADSPVIRIVQGTANSTDLSTSRNFPLAVRPYEQSSDIIGNNVYVYRGKGYAGPVKSTWVVGAATGSTGVLNTVDNSEYLLRLAFRGERQQDFNTSTHGGVGRTFSFTSPEYSTLGLTSDVDHLVQNLGYVINRNSKQFNFGGPSFGATMPVMALALDASGGSGVAITSVAGTSVPVVVTQSGTTKSITLDAELVRTLAAVVASGSVPNTATIELIDLSTAGAGTADQLLLVALDESTAYVDRKPNIKNRLAVGLDGAFDYSTVLSAQLSKAFEGSGTGRQMTILYDNTARQRVYSQYRGYEVVRIDYPTPVSTSGTYDVYTIESYDSNHLAQANISNSPLKTIILVPTAATTTKAELEAILNPYMASTPNAFPPVTL